MEKNKKKLLKCRNKFDDNNSTNENNSNQEQPTKSPKSSNDDNDDVKKVEEIIVCPGSDEEANDDDDDDDKNGHFNHRSQEQQQQQRPQFRSSLERGIIPDAKTIYELKKRRQKMALTADFIPLENESGNRQVHESDEDKSENDDDDLLPNSDCDDDHDDDDKDRIQFGNVDYESKDKEKFRECFRVAQQQQQQQKNENQKQNNDSKYSSSSGDDDDHDNDNIENEESEEEEDEMDKWEREQIRKAVRMPNIYHLARSEMNNKFLTTMDDKTLINKLQVIHDNHSIVPIEIDQMDYRSYGNNIPSYIVDQSTDNNNDDLNFDSFTDRIHSMRKQIETTIDENQQLLNRIMMDLKLSKNDIEKYNIIDVVEMTDEYNLYRNLYDYIRNLFDCINDKMIE